MKPIQLAKILICGLSASSFLLVNCSYSSPREVKANTDNKQGVVQQNLVTCSKKAIKLLTDRRDLLTKMSQVIAVYENNLGEPDATQKANLQNQIEELAPISKSIVAEIKVAKGNSNKEPTGCLQIVADSDKKITHSISEILSLDLNFAKKVQKITKKTNSIIEGQKPKSGREQSEDQNQKAVGDAPNSNQDVVNPETDGRQFVINEEFAELLNSANLIRESIISEGKIEVGAIAKAMIENPSEGGLKTFCFLEATTETFLNGDKLKIAAFKSKKQENFSLVKVAFVANSEKMIAVACRLNTQSEPLENMLKVFSGFLTKE
jgi:hypothetical protein